LLVSLFLRFQSAEHFFYEGAVVELFRNQLLDRSAVSEFD
jgi:hypothetical protein